MQGFGLSKGVHSWPGLGFRVEGLGLGWDAQS